MIKHHILSLYFTFSVFRYKIAISIKHFGFSIFLSKNNLRLFHHKISPFSNRYQYEMATFATKWLVIIFLKWRIIRTLTSKNGLIRSIIKLNYFSFTATNCMCLWLFFTQQYPIIFFSNSSLVFTIRNWILRIIK